MAKTTLSVTIADVDKTGTIFVSLLSDAILKHAERRGYTPPMGLSGPGWITTEIAEVFEIFLGREAEWVRNNPEDHEDISDEHLEEELADIVFMAVYVGVLNGVSPLKRLVERLHNAETNMGETS